MAYLKENPTVTTFASGDLITFSRGTTDKTIDSDDLLADLTTTDLTEGANLYYTDERNDDRTAVLIQNGTGISWSYSDGAGTLTPTVSLSSFDVEDLAQTTLYKYVERDQIEISHSAILTLNSSPVVLVDPIASRTVGVHAVTVYSTNSVTGYTNSGIDIVDTTTGAILMSIPSTAISGTGNQAAFAQHAATTGVLVTYGGGISVKAKTSDPTNGNIANRLKITVDFTYHDFV